MRIFLLLVTALCMANCSKEKGVFAGEHSDETVSVMLLDSEDAGFGTAIATLRGETDSSCSGSAPTFNGGFSVHIKSVSSESFTLAYSVTLQGDQALDSPYEGVVTVKYNQNEIVDLGDGFRLRIISHEGDIDPNYL